MRYLKIKDAEIIYEDVEGQKTRFVKVTVENVGPYATMAKIGTAKLKDDKVVRWYDYEITEIYPDSEYTAKLIAYEGAPDLYVVATRCKDIHCNSVVVEDKLLISMIRQHAEHDIYLLVGASFAVGLICGFVIKSLLGG